MGYNGYTDKKKETNKRYIENNDLVRISLVLPEGEKKNIIKEAKRSGTSINKYILEAIHEKMQKSDEIK